MARILFLAHRYPYPPNKGDKIRAFHFVEHLLKSHEVALGFVMTPGDAEPDLSWAKRFSDVYCGRISAFDRLVRTGASLFKGEALSIGAFRHGGLKAWVKRHAAEKQPDLSFAFSSAAAQYAPPDIPMILDFVDVDSEKWRQYGATLSGPRAWFYAMEARRLLAHDRAEAVRADASLFVSEDEKRIFDRLSPETQAKSFAIGNGVDVGFFDPSKVPPRSGGEPMIVFVGMMDYWPNVDAVTWFAKEILPLIRAKHESARFQIVGAKPTAAVTALRTIAGVEVTGKVDDVRPYVGAADVVVAPLRIARGIQNKVLEGMAMARPVVTTPGALEGIGAMHGRDVLVGATAEEIAAAVCSVLGARTSPALGAAARAFVLKHHDWSTNLGKLDVLVGRILGRPR